MRHPPQRLKVPLHVTVVADNPETLDGLGEYFRRVGVGVRGTRQILGSPLASQASSAIVFFPDDFKHHDVVTALDQLQHGRRRIVVIVVTADPRRFEPLTDAGINAPVVIAKPAWGWTILDTIRGEVGA